MKEIWCEFMKVEVDKDILDFLKAIYFGDFTDPMKAASSRAYRDMNRTIRFHSLPLNIRMKLRKDVTAIFEREIPLLVNKGIKNQEEFDKWHFNLCCDIRKIYREKNIFLTFGQTQKWVNMTIKYLYMLELYSFEDIFRWLHIPLDHYVFDIARDILGIDRPQIAWSKWDDYEKEYLAYQKKIREKVKVCEPLRWEFRFWLKAARNIEVLNENNLVKSS